MTTKPELKFPLRADGEIIFDANGTRQLESAIIINSNHAHRIATCAMIVRLANLGHEAHETLAKIDGMVKECQRRIGYIKAVLPEHVYNSLTEPLKDASAAIEEATKHE